MTTPRPQLCILAALAACATPAPHNVAATPSFCTSTLAYDYDPTASLSTFPDDHWTVADPDTPTGLRIALDPEDPAVDDYPEGYDDLLAQLATLDGFGLSGELVLGFTRALPDDLEDLDVRVLVEEDGNWAEQPRSLRTIDSGRTLLVRPYQILPPASRVALAVHTDTPSGCIAPSPVLQTMLTDPAEPLHDRLGAALDGLDWQADEVGALAVFTTQSAGTVDAAVAADISTHSYTFDPNVDCTDEGEWRACTGSVQVGDYRDAAGTVPEGVVAVHDSYDLPVSVWLPPAEIEGPYPVALCGHGLGGGARQCGFMAGLAAPEGLAVVAIDAQEHGDHPARSIEDGSDLDQIMAMFGFTLVPPSLDALVMRDNLRASAWDKLQVVAAIEQGVDVDGDGLVDLDADHMQYVGASLGGIMGPELLAWAPGIDAGTLIVPGGGLLYLIVDSDIFGLIATAMTPGDWDEDDLWRALPLVQTLVDAGDPLVHAGLMTRARQTEGGPDLALLMAVGDTVVPNSATASLAQALQVDLIGTEWVAMEGVDLTEGPVQSNLVDGATGALIQLAEIQSEDGAAWEAADHSTVHESVQTRDLLVPFMRAVVDGETPSLSAPEAP